MFSCKTSSFEFLTRNRYFSGWIFSQLTWRITPWNAFESLLAGDRLILSEITTILPGKFWIFILISRILIQSLIYRFLILSISFVLPIEHSIRSKNILFLFNIFQKNPHLLNFIILLLVVMDLIIKKLIGTSRIFIIMINLRFKCTFFHLLTINLLF